MILYTDIDPFCCQWMENLIEAGQLPAGIVFRSDVREIDPTCLKEIDQAHIFAGIGGWAYALELAGWPRDWPVWTGSCPCQPWSVAGHGKGEDDERHLWPEWFQLIRECKPPIIFGEQVASPAGRSWLDIVSDDMESAGYAVGSANLCACGIGAPHLRQRLYWVAVSCQQRCEGIRLHLSEWEKRGRMLEAGWCGEVGGLANTDSIGQERCADAKSETRSKPRSCLRGNPYWSTHALEYTAGVRPERTCESEIIGAWARRPTRGTGAPDSAMGNTDEDRSPRNAGAVSETEEKTQLRNEPYRIESPSPVSGFWRNAEWLYGRDGKFRPAEPGSFPLAPRLPRGMGRLRPWERKLADVAGADVRSLKEAGRNRVGRLRGYGNAIVPQLAAEFIRAVMEIK
jgi:DNA (cytosine-5)-methyltransferase 1